MWLKIGSYPEKESAAEIASKLSSSGARIEVKVYVDWELEEKCILRGKLSELKAYGYEEVEEWERYVEILRELLKKPMNVSEFERKFLELAKPDAYELAKKFKDSSISDEEFFDAAESAFQLSLLISAIYGFLRMNGVEVENVIAGSLPEDPEVIIELEDERDGCQKLYMLTFIPVWDVYVDVLSLIGAEIELDGEEGAVLDAAARLVANITAKIRDEQQLDRLRDYSGGLIEASSSPLDGDVIVDGGEIFDIIIKALEKAGIVRISGNRITLRR